MTISSTPRKAGPYVGNGIATSFSFAFKVFVASDLVVTKTSVASGAESVLTLTTDYTVSLNADQNTNPGGIVTYNPGGVPMPSTYNLTITSEVPQTQGTDIPNAGGFYPEVLEDALDKNVILAQQLEEVVSRTLQFPVADSTPPQIPPFATRKNRVLGFDGNGLFTTYPTTAGVAAGSFADTTIATAGQTVINVRQYVMGVNTLAVFLNGVRQEAGADYTETTSTSYTFTFALAAGDKVISVIGQESAGIGATDAALVSYLPEGAGAVVSNVQTKLREIVGAKAFGGTWDGVVDDSAAMQKAIDHASTLVYGAVWLPTNAKFSNITLKHGVKLFGQGVNACKVSVTDLVNPVLMLQDYTEIDGIEFFYPNQVTTGTPTAYPATITNAATENASYTHISNVRAKRAYDFITLGGASASPQKITIENVDGYPYHKGIAIDACSDTLRCNNIHFVGNIETYQPSLLNWIFNNGIAIQTGKADAPLFSNIVVLGYQTGYYAYTGTGGVTNMLAFSNFLIDQCNIPISMDAHGNGCTFANGEVTSQYNYAGLGSNGNPCTIGGGTATNVVTFNAVNFRHFYTDAVVTGTHCIFNACSFNDFNIQATAFHYGIKIGAANIYTQINACQFTCEGKANTRSVCCEGGAAVGTTTIITGTVLANCADRSIFVETGNILQIAASSVSGGIYYNGLNTNMLGNDLSVGSIPAAGTWSAGQRFVNSTPAVGQPKAWVCTVAGSPGTWVSEGNL